MGSGKGYCFQVRKRRVVETAPTKSQSPPPWTQILVPFLTCGGRFGELVGAVSTARLFKDCYFGFFCTGK